MINQKNDWFAVVMKNPEISDLQQLADYNITPENTGMDTKENYKQLPGVIQAFTENGKFNETKFDNAYKSALDLYNVYTESDFEQNLLESFEYDADNYFAPVDAKRRDTSPVLYKNAN